MKNQLSRMGVQSPDHNTKKIDHIKFCLAYVTPTISYLTLNWSWIMIRDDSTVGEA